MTRSLHDTWKWVFCNVTDIQTYRLTSMTESAQWANSVKMSSKGYSAGEVIFFGIDLQAKRPFIMNKLKLSFFSAALPTAVYSIATRKPCPSPQKSFV